MSETHDETQEPEEPVVPSEEPGTPETEGEEQTPDVEPSEADAETEAENEREEELAAQRQEQAQAQARDDADIERRNKALTRAADAYVKKIVDALGPELDGAHPCPLCADFFPGFRFPIMPPAENLALIKAEIGEDLDPPLENDSYSRTCDSCKGLGKVWTGSRVRGQESAQCLTCEGRGWIAVGDERKSGNVLSLAPTPPAPAAPLQDNPSNEPPEAAMLRQLGFVVVAPITAETVVS